jgi:hypothetical protein
MVSEQDVINIRISDKELAECIDNAKNISQHIVDRGDLHSRDGLERFINVLLGEVSEMMVLNWLKNEKKLAHSAVEKGNKAPDHGHDILLTDKQGAQLTCSVKSSLSYKLDISGILGVCKLATKAIELRDVNIQVYFWLTLNPPLGHNRITVPTIRQSALIGWFIRNDLKEFSAYKHEQRESPTATLKNARPMKTLLEILK